LSAKGKLRRTKDPFEKEKGIAKADGETFMKSKKEGNPEHVDLLKKKIV